MRDQLVSSRTRLINQARAFCLEYGIAMRQGVGTFRVDLPRVLADDSNDLSQAMRQMLKFWTTSAMSITASYRSPGRLKRWPIERTGPGGL